MFLNKDKRLLSLIYEALLQINKKKAIKPIEKCTKSGISGNDTIII